MGKKNKTRPHRTGKSKLKPKAVVPPGPQCPVGGDHVPLVFPEKAPSPWSSRPDRMVIFDGRDVPEAEGFRVQIAICTKCRLLYMAKFSPTDAVRDAEVAALRKELADARALLDDDDPHEDVPQNEDHDGDDPEDVDAGDDDGDEGGDDG